MKNTLMKSLLKAKNNENEELEALIDSYVLGVKKNNLSETKSFVADLLVFIMKKTEQDVDKDVLIELVNSKISSLGYSVETAAIEDIYEKTAIAAASSVGVKFSFDQTDTETLKSMYRAITWMREDGTVNTQEKLKKVVAQAMEGEVNLADLGDTLRQEFQGVIDESAHYFRLASDQLIRRSQSLTHVEQFASAGVEYAKIVTVHDLKRSAICTSLDSKIISVKHLQRQSSAIMAATSVDEMKQASRWQTKPIFGVLPAHVGLPPYHGFCRTILVAYFPQSADIDGKNVNGSLLPGEKYKADKEVLFSHQDRFGYERVLTDKTLSHGGNPHSVPKKDIVSGLNTLEQMAIHKEFPSRTIGYSKDKDLFFVFNDGEVHTVFSDIRKGYFKDNADIDSIQSFSLRKGVNNEKV